MHYTFFFDRCDLVAYGIGKCVCGEPERNSLLILAPPPLFCRFRRSSRPGE